MPDSLDCVLHEFEHRLVDERSPSIDEFLEGWQGSKRKELLNELVMLEMDYRIRGVSQKTTNAIGKTHWVCHKDLPTLEEYWQRFPELGEIAQITVDQIAEEYAARLRHGVPTRIESLCNRFPWHSDSLQVHLLEIGTTLNRLEPLCHLQAEVDGVRRTCFRFCTRLRIGRQKRNDPQPFRQSYEDFLCRMIVAPKHERRIARNHLELEPFGYKCIRVSNISAKSETVVDWEERIGPASARCFELPIRIQIGELVLHCSSTAKTAPAAQGEPPVLE